MALTVKTYEEAAGLGALLSREYARDLLAILAAYKDISASEAASRLGLHVKTAQDFLDGLHSAGIAGRREVSSGKRPHLRYFLAESELILHFDIGKLTTGRTAGNSGRMMSIREKAGSGVVFKAAGSKPYISSVHYFIGTGRTREEKRLSLTRPQGIFLFHLPFPTEGPETVSAIMAKAGLDDSFSAEILDLVGFLSKNGIIEAEEG